MPHIFHSFLVCVCSSLVYIYSQFHWDQIFVPWHYVSGSTHMPLLPWLTYPDQEPLWLFTLVQPYREYRATFLLSHKWLLYL